MISAYESGRRQPRSDARPLSGPVGRRVRRHRARLRRIAADYDVRDVHVFGSVARGEDGANSDVDLLIKVPETMGLFALGRLQQELEDVLGVAVDLVPTAGLKPDVHAAIDADLVTL